MRSQSPSLAAATAPLLLAALAFLARPAAAQNRQRAEVVRGVATTPEGARAAAAFERAQRLVSEGQGAAGRAIVDSTIAATDSASAVFPEGLFWRASLSATAADAERDYRTLAVEYPLSPRSADALLRLAQLEMARGDRALALRHLERLTLEHPTSAARPRASYWMARVYFEDADVPHACAALGAARANAAPTEGALRAQIDAYAPRCKGGATALAAAAAAASDGGKSAPATTTAATTTATATAAESAGTRTQSAAGARAVARDTISIFAGAAMASPASATAASTATATTVAATTVVPTSTSPTVAAPSPAPASGSAVTAATTRAPGTKEVPAAPFPAVASAASPVASPPASVAASPNAAAAVTARTPVPNATAGVARSASPATVAPTSASAPRSAAPARAAFAVQLAAFDASAPAEAMAARLRARGVDARVSGTAAPFRVRVGRYATSGAAAKAAAAFKAHGQPAFVVDEPAATPATPTSVAGTGPR